MFFTVTRLIMRKHRVSLHWGLFSCFVFFFLVICLELLAVNRKCSGCVFRRMRLPSHHPQNNDGYIYDALHRTLLVPALWFDVRGRGACAAWVAVTPWQKTAAGAQNQNINEESDKYIQQQQQQQLRFKKGANSLEKLLLIRHMYHIIRRVRQIRANKVMCCLHLLSFHSTKL